VIQGVKRHPTTGDLTIRRSVTLPLVAYETLRKQARDEHRSLDMHMRMILERHVNAA
jgi:hypothetical protein